MLCPDGTVDYTSIKSRVLGHDIESNYYPSTGTRVVTTWDGSAEDPTHSTRTSTQYNADGSTQTTTRGPNGLVYPVTYTNPHNGTVMQAYPDKVITVQRDGTITTWDYGPHGSLITDKPDGTIITKKPDGTIITRKPVGGDFVSPAK